MHNTLEPGVPGGFPSESAALQTSLTVPTGGAILMTCVSPAKDEERSPATASSTRFASTA